MGDFPAGTNGWLRLHEAARAYGLPYHRLYMWYRRGLVRGRRTADGVLVDVASIEEQFPPRGWEWLSRALERRGLGRYLAMRLIREGRLHARKVGRRWLVETASLEDCAREHTISPGWVGTAEAGRRLGTSSPYSPPKGVSTTAVDQGWGERRPAGQKG